MTSERASIAIPHPRLVQAQICGPRRIQRPRSDAWTIPDGAVLVDHPSSPWANPFLIGSIKRFINDQDRRQRIEVETPNAVAAVENYRWLFAQPEHVEQIRAELAGRDLVCGCPGDPCHANVLLDLANSTGQVPAPPLPTWARTV